MATSSPGSYQGVTINPGTDAQVASQIASINASKTPTVNSSNPVDASRLGAQPFTVPQAGTPTAASSGQEYISSLNQSNQNADQQATQNNLDFLKATKVQGQNDITTLSNQLAGRSQEQDTLYASSGVDDLKRQLDDVSHRIEAEQVSNRHAVENLQKNNPNGMLTGALNDTVNRLNGESFSRQADLAVVQNAANNKYETAKSIIDRKIESETEADKIRLENLKFFYQENSDNLSKAEDRQYQAKIQAEERKYNETVQAKKELGDTQLQLLQSAGAQGAPLSVKMAIQSAKTPQEAITAAGVYAGDVLDRKIKQAQLSKLVDTGDITPQQATTVANDPGFNNVQAEAIPLASLLKEYNTFLSENTALGINLSPNKTATKNTLISQITAEYKQAKKLGTLDAGVQKLIDGVLGNTGLAKFSNKAQMTAVSNFLKQLGYDQALGDPIGLSDETSVNNNPLGI